MKRKQITSTIALSGVLCLFGAADAMAQRISVQVNGDPVAFSGVGPRQIEGRVLVPLRGVLEKIGAHVGWVPSSQTVIASKGNMDLQLKIGSRTAQVNGRNVTLDVPAMMIAGSTMVPLRFVGEALGAEVGWNGTTQTVLITTDGQPADTGKVADQTPPPAQNTGAPSITSLTHNQGTGWLKADEKLVVTMEGTPGGKASFRMPGVNVAMTEVSPGTYRGEWTPRKGQDIFTNGVALIGHLTKDGQAARELQSGNAVKIDTVPPTITNMTPPPNSQVTTRQPLISATFSDSSGSGMSLDNTRVLLDNRDITNDGTLNNREFTYRPQTAMAAEKHTVKVVARDKAGNATSKTWSFNMAATTSAIKSVDTNATEALEPGDVLTVRVVGTPGSKAVFDFGGIKNRPLTEEQSGVYTGSYTIRKTDNVTDAPVVARLTTPAGETYTSSTDRAIEVAVGPPAAPQIISPKADAALPNPLVVSGTAAPNSTVRLKIDYANPVLGGALALRGTAAEVDIPVGADGKWTSDPINLSSLFNSRDTKYTISAVAINSKEEESKSTTLQLSRR